MRATPVVMLLELRCGLAYLFQGSRTLHGQARFLIRAMIAFDKAILLGMLWVTHQHADFQKRTKADGKSLPEGLLTKRTSRSMRTKPRQGWFTNPGNDADRHPFTS